MLTPKYLQDAPNEIVDIYLKLEEQLLSDISKGIAKNVELVEGAEYQLKIMQEMGYDLKKIEKEIAKTTKISQKEIEKLLRGSSELSYNDDRKRYKEGGKDLPSIDNNPKMIDFIEGVIENSKGDLLNLTRTMGFVDNKGFNLINKFYKDTLNQAVFQVGSGGYSYQDAIYQAVKKLGDSGIRTIDYSSGRAYHIESAVRMNVLTSLNQITGHMSIANADMMDQDLMEITAHAMARPDHANWQGQIVSRSGRSGYLSLEDIGYETPGGFQGVNCRHGWYCYFEGISKPAYTEKQLKELEGEPIVFDGKEYTPYEVSQRMRQLERNMRHTRRQIIVYEGSGLEDKALSSKIRLRGQGDLYKDFSKVAGIRPKFERIGVYRRE